MKFMKSLALFQQLSSRKLVSAVEVIVSYNDMLPKDIHPFRRMKFPNKVKDSEVRMVNYICR